MTKSKKEMLLFSIGNALKIIPNDKYLQKLFFEIQNITFSYPIESIGNYELGRLKRFVFLHVIDWDYEEKKSKSDYLINNEQIVINFINSIPKYLLDYKVYFYKNTPYGKKNESNQIALLTAEIVDTQIKLFYTNTK
jgi:hypothetical protein